MIGYLDLALSDYNSARRTTPHVWDAATNMERPPIMMGFLLGTRKFMTRALTFPPIRGFGT